MAELTPMMKQWSDLKAQAGDALLFFRLGDFYELFEQDAVTAAPVLQITLTSRNNKGANGPASPLCGVPVHQLENYLPRVLDRGFKVALAEQTEVPQPGKNLVRREIVQWFTPGIRFLSQDTKNHYLAVLLGTPNQWVLAAADVATGATHLETGQELEALQDLIYRLPIKDLRCASPELWNLEVAYLESLYPLSALDAEAEIREALQLVDRKDSPAESKMETQALGSLFQILKLAHPKERLRFLRPTQTEHEVWTTASTKRNLYLFEPEAHSLFALMNRSATALGRRRLKEVLNSPTFDSRIIVSRQNLVRLFKIDSALRRLLKTQWSDVLDLQRLLRKRRGPLELFQISKSLEKAIGSSDALPNSHEEILKFKTLSEKLKNLSEALSLTLQMSEEEEINWIREGISSELDQLRSLKANSSRKLSELEESLRTETGVSSLKIKFHQVFGYVAELTASNREKIPAKAKRIQTLANSERFKTVELEELEEKLLSVEGRLKEAEAAQIEKLYEKIESQVSTLYQWMESLAELDAALALAETSAALNWSTPRTIQSAQCHLKIQEAVHPLAPSHFVPLSFDMSEDTQRLILLTGPNMAGKSTLLRMAALCAYLHQVGSDVPAAVAELSLFDRIACRMGSGDDLTTGQSTFFVEMREVAGMVRGATEKSLLVFDEIGRGTSTYDGMSLAWAITEAVHDLGGLSLIATHYLELAELERTLKFLKCFHLGVKEQNGTLTFTRRLVEGAASKSYGIQVAKLADLAPTILTRAERKLRELERRRTKALPLFELAQNS